MVEVAFVVAVAGDASYAAGVDVPEAVQSARMAAQRVAAKVKAAAVSVVPVVGHAAMAAA